MTHPVVIDSAVKEYFARTELLNSVGPVEPDARGDRVAGQSAHGVMTSSGRSEFVKVTVRVGGARLGDAGLVESSQSIRRQLTNRLRMLELDRSEVMQRSVDRLATSPRFTIEGFLELLDE